MKGINNALDQYPQVPDILFLSALLIVLSLIRGGFVVRFRYCVIGIVVSARQHQS